MDEGCDQKPRCWSWVASHWTQLLRDGLYYKKIKIIIKCSITVSAGADLQAGKRAQTVLSVSQNLSILWANFAVLNIAPHKEVLVRQMSLENPMKKALAC